MSTRAEFHALWYHLGPYGRQDVHLHPRIDREGTDDVLVGAGVDCTPKAIHVRKRLTVGARWSQRSQEGQPLERHGVSPASGEAATPKASKAVAGSGAPEGPTKGDDE